MPVVPRIDHLYSGIVGEDDDAGMPNPAWFIEDTDTGIDLTDLCFRSEQDARAYLDAHREEIMARGLPPLEAEEIRLYRLALGKAASGLDAGTVSADSARDWIKHLSKVEQRCPDEDFRNRLAALLDRLRKV